MRHNKDKLSLKGRGTNGSSNDASSQGEKTLARRIDLSCSELELPEPPSAVHLRPRWPCKDPFWWVRAETTAGRVPSIQEWLRRWDPVDVFPAPGLAPKSITARFRGLENPWQVLADAEVQQMVLTPVGTATLVVETDAAKLKQRLNRLKDGLGIDQMRVRPYYGKTTGETEHLKLTPRQEEVLSVAVAMGYYEVPRRVSLRDLAKKLDMSLGATSELIRRGESLIVGGFIDSLSMTEKVVGEPEVIPWSGRTNRSGAGPDAAIGDPAE